MTFPRILRMKIAPPPRSARTLPRPRVSRALSESLQYRLAILQAGAGHGKSTALAELSVELQPLIWYQVSPEDADPFVFLFHLCHATQVAVPDIAGLPTAYLEAWDGTQGPLPWRGVLDQYLNTLSEGLASPSLLVLDDIHLALESGEIAQILDRLIGLAPAPLHILLSGRPPIQLPNLSRWRARGEVLSLDQTVLTFTAPETAALFAQQYEFELTSDEVETLLAYTEGWAIALQLIWQNLRSQSLSALDLPSPRPLSSPDALFEVLAREVFGLQSEDVREFLVNTAPLRELLPEACDALRSAIRQAPSSGALRDSAAMLAFLRRQDLFVVETSAGTLRYHNIFHDFLRQQVSAAQWEQWHIAAADYFTAHRSTENALYHYSQARAWEEMAQRIEEMAPQLLAVGRLDTLAAHIDSLPPEKLNQHPALLFYLGELARLHSRFEEALGWYGQAETRWRERGLGEGIGRALRGQARVYLDTVNPSKAEEILQQALRLSDGTADREAQARLYELLAENKLNAGRVAEAERLRQQAEDLRREGPADSQLLIRVQLRTGRLAEARRQLEILAEAERQEPVHTSRSHRETQLLLSIIYAMQGEPHAAYQSALEGTQRGVDLSSPFVIAVGHMRQGHALMMLAGNNRLAEARREFEAAVAISRSLAIPRLRVEACWGLCQAFGRQGELAEAAKVAQEGIELAAQAGDEWIASLIRLAMGANLTLAARYESAASWLGQAARGFKECSDPFGDTASRLWLCLGWLGQNQRERLEQTFPEVLETCRQHGYDFLLTRPTLLGVPNERMIIPLLILARNQQWADPYPARLLDAIGLPGIVYHPGYQLRIFTLGKFQAWRGDQPVPHNGWRRDKTRQLFQLLLASSRAPIERDQICEHLWPGVEPASAQRNFKVALSTLYDVLEPGRSAGGESAYVLREGAVYSLRPGADFWLDSEAFAALARQADGLFEREPEAARLLYRQALALYQGEYLPDARYETWAAAEREHLAVIFLNAADRYCELCLRQTQLEEAIEACQRILAHDNCWERAYRYLMLAYDRLGDRGQVARAYQRCIQTLREELDVSPSEETETLYRRLVDM